MIYLLFDSLWISLIPNLLSPIDLQTKAIRISIISWRESSPPRRSRWAGSTQSSAGIQSESRPRIPTGRIRKGSGSSGLCLVVAACCFFLTGLLVGSGSCCTASICQKFAEDASSSLLLLLPIPTFTFVHTDHPNLVNSSMNSFPLVTLTVQYLPTVPTVPTVLWVLLSLSLHFFLSILGPYRILSLS